MGEKDGQGIEDMERVSAKMEGCRIFRGAFRKERVQVEILEMVGNGGKGNH